MFFGQEVVSIFDRADCDVFIQIKPRRHIHDVFFRCQADSLLESSDAAISVNEQSPLHGNGVLDRAGALACARLDVKR